LEKKQKGASLIADDGCIGEDEMIICKVIGHVWATKKESSLEGAKLMIVRDVYATSADAESRFVAADIVGAGIGEKVLVVTGSTARSAVGESGTSIDAAIVGIVDALEQE
jgi:ethanolamine utilization protein EutN